MEYNIDLLRIKENKKVLNGWVIPNNHTNYIQVEVCGINNEILPTNILLSRRIDVSLVRFADKEHHVFGFEIHFPKCSPDQYQLVFKEYKEEIFKRTNEILKKEYL